MTVWQGHTVSVVLPTYRERGSIRAVVLDFLQTGVVDEVIVVNNNAEAGTSDAIAGTGAREVHEPMQGYGYAIRRGLREANTDYIAVCEPDATFAPRDIFKLLAYADNFDIVYGSRTSPQLVWTGANMGLFLRWGNWFVAKYLEFLFNATNLTDVGCTMRLIGREAAVDLAPHFKIGGSEFGPEMIIRSLRAGYRVIQIPVNYKPRVGSSSVTGDPIKAFRLGLRMIALITKARFERPTMVNTAQSRSSSDRGPDMPR
jgi:glycosyltransferase involved in cell wall biosynthesis